MAPTACCTDNLRAAAIVVATLGAYATNDAILKLVMLNLPEAQAMAVRALIVVPLLAALSACRGELCTPTSARDWRLLLLRASCETMAAFCFLAAIHIGAMADVSVVISTQPLLVMLGAACFYGERIERGSWVLAVGGLLGVAVVARPNAAADTSSSWLLYAMATSVLGSIRDLLARQLGSRVPSTRAATISATCIGAGGAVIAMPSSDWSIVSRHDVMLLSIAAVFVAAALVGSVYQMRLGEVGFVQPFRYSFIVWATLFGAAFFGHWPDRWTVSGALIVVGCGVASLWREHVRTRPDELKDNGELCTEAEAARAAEDADEDERCAFDGHQATYTASDGRTYLA